eukprot:scaffold185846_cov83-Attheya_sp.AAC.1
MAQHFVLEHHWDSFLEILTPWASYLASGMAPLIQTASHWLGFLLGETDNVGSILGLKDGSIDSEGNVLGSTVGV